MVIMRTFNYLNEIEEEGEPKITFPNDLLGGSQSKKEATTSTTIIVIENLFGLIESKASS